MSRRRARLAARPMPSVREPISGKGGQSSASIAPRRTAWTAARIGIAVAIMAAVGVIAFIGWSAVSRPGSAVSRPATAPSGGEPPVAAVGTGVGQLAPDFQLVEVDGQTINRDSLRGKPALLWFTAAYCIPCQEGALRLQPILEDLGADSIRIVMVFIDPTEPPAALVDWRQRFGRPEWSVAFDAGGRMTRDYGVQYLDTKYLLDREGVIRYTDVVTLQPDVWRPQIENVIGGS